ncbi:unnamed protein product [Mytilus coruscus]|uniref:YqaJ viral recombinase domain-containing protein n=1 Tax=Mytilus coruscus TaxID=42192 RepID=A0A6J8DP60_MYTCO|nr:unnamed protein product [Mytilus coruscus]
MSGEKSIGQITDGSTSKGIYDPASSSINFAVPSVNRINEFESPNASIPREILPGVIHSSIGFLPKNKSFVLSVDGKKMATGLTDERGDQDLFQHEDGESLKLLQDLIDEEITNIETTKTSWSSMEPTEQASRLMQIIKIVSHRIKDLRALLQKQKFALNKFFKDAGDDWRNSKYVFAISSIQTMIYQIKSVIKRLLSVNDCLLEKRSDLYANKNAFAKRDTIDTYSQVNWITLKDPESLPDSAINNSRFIKQRTDQWIEMRKKFKLTGSTLYEGIGLDTLKNQQRHFDKVVRGVNTQEEFSEEVRNRMPHGIVSEVHAIATLVGKIVPLYHPDLQFVEEGDRIIFCEDRPFILVSPDGGLGIVKLENTPDNITDPKVACEFKCPVGTDYKTPVHYEIPVSWSAESSTVFQVSFDEELWKIIIDEALSVYSTESLKRPTRISEAAKNIKRKLSSFRQEHTEFLCEVKSVKATSLNISQTQT